MHVFYNDFTMILLFQIDIHIILLFNINHFIYIHIYLLLHQNIYKYFV